MGGSIKRGNIELAEELNKKIIDKKVNEIILALIATIDDDNTSFNLFKILNKLELVSREEFEVLKSIVQKQDKLIKQLKNNTKSKKVKKS